MAPASAAGAASLSPSRSDGQQPGSCTVRTLTERGAPRAVSTSWALRGAADSPTVAPTNTKKNTASAATAVGPLSRPSTTSRHGATATHGAAFASAASRLMARRSGGTVAVSRAATNASTPPMTRPRVADHSVARVARQ